MEAGSINKMHFNYVLPHVDLVNFKYKHYKEVFYYVYFEAQFLTNNNNLLFDVTISFKLDY